MEFESRVTGKRMVRLSLIVIASFSLIACSEGPVSVDTSNLSEGAKTCLISANLMIDIARDAVNDNNSRPERRESRRMLMEDWIARLEGGEDPCSVYEAIGNASTSF